MFVVTNPYNTVPAQLYGCRCKAIAIEALALVSGHGRWGRLLAVIGYIILYYSMLWLWAIISVSFIQVAPWGILHVFSITTPVVSALKNYYR
jgi:hypothetical protein